MKCQGNGYKTDKLCLELKNTKSDTAVISKTRKTSRKLGYGPIYKVSQEECARLREGVPYVKVYRYNPKHLCPKLNGYGDNGQRSLKL